MMESVEEEDECGIRIGRWGRCYVGTMRKTIEKGRSLLFRVLFSY